VFKKGSRGVEFQPFLNAFKKRAPNLCLVLSQGCSVGFCPDMAHAPVTIRRAEARDAAQMVAIYRPFVEHTVVSFEVTVPDEAEFADRIAAVVKTHEWLVAELDGSVVGYAYGGKHRSREAYRFSTEVSAYIAEGHRGRGIARQLYERLFERLAARGYCNALAGIALPNDASIAFHTSLGFARVGVYHGVGFKHDQWHDVAWYERRLREGPPASEPGV